MVDKVAVKVRSMAGVTKAVAITSAKVPIVKMVHSGFKLEADISLYNRLAQENTRMLALYASIDERARQLGYLVKLFAKTIGIGDASKGSLSSYAYLLMMIFYLQQVEPPVLPVLQQFGLEANPRGKKNVRNSEYSGFRLFGRIEWVPPLNTKKLLRVIRRTGKQPWGIFY